MKLRDILALLLIAVVAIGGRIFGGDAPGERRPDPGRPSAAPPAGRNLPPESFHDPRLIVDVGEKNANATGTAFSVDRSGVWITARHVTEGCATVALRRSDGRLVRTRRVAAQDYADMSLLWTRGGAPPLPIIRPELRVGEDGYSFGFPQGEPGDVHARLVGRSRMLARGRYRTDEPVVAWTQIRRVPDRGPDLGGISGGPWVNANGEVIGVHVAGAPRRGRSYSTAPRTLLQAVENASLRPGAGRTDRPENLTPGRFERYGDELRRRQTVAQVVCLVR